MRNISDFPANLDAERCVLGACIESPDILGAVMAEDLRAEDFSVRDHVNIWEAVVDLSAAGSPVTLLSLLDHSPQLDLAALVDLTCGVVLVESHILHYVRILKRHAALRSLLYLSEWLEEKALTVGADPREISQQLENTLRGIPLASEHHDF